MEYIVEATKTIFGKEAYKVVNKKLESLDDWVYEAFLLDIPFSEDGDIIFPFFDFVKDNFNSAQFEREALVDSQRNCFTGLSVTKIKFLEFNEANGYASLLNEKLKEKGE